MLPSQVLEAPLRGVELFRTSVPGLVLVSALVAAPEIAPPSVTVAPVEMSRVAPPVLIATLRAELKLAEALSVPPAMVRPPLTSPRLESAETRRVPPLIDVPPV